MVVLRRVFRQIPGTAQANARIDLVAALLFGAFAGLTFPFIPVMGRRLGAGPMAVSLLVASQAAVLLLSLVWAHLLRAVHPVHLVVWPQAIGRTLFLAMPLVHTPGPYVTLVLLYHGIASISSLGYAQVMRSAYPEEARPRIMATIRVGMGLVWIVSSLVGGQVMQLLPFQWVFAAAGILGTAGALVFTRVRLQQENETTEGATLAGVWGTLRGDRAFRGFLIAFFTFGFGVWMTGPAIPILLVDVLHASNFQVGLLGAITAGTSVLAYVQWGRLIERRKPAGALVIAFLVGTATSMIYLGAVQPWMALPAGVTDGVASAGIELGWLTAVLQFAPPGQVASYVAIYNTLLGIRASTAPFLAGLLIPILGVRVIFALAATLTLIAAVLMWRVTARSRAFDEP